MTKIIAALAIFGLLCALLYIAYSRRAGASDSAAVVKEVRRLNQLATVKYSIEKVVGMKEDASPVGSESILLLVRGTVIAGVNLAELTSNDVSISPDKTVRIRLSKPDLQEAFLDEKYTKVWDRSVTWWTPWVTPDADLEHKARLQALANIRQEALDMGILKEAQRNTEADIRGILEAFGLENVVFAFGS